MFFPRAPGIPEVGPRALHSQPAARVRRVLRSLVPQSPAPGAAALNPQVSAGDRPMAERGELDLTGAKQNTGVWLVKVRFAWLPLLK